MTLWRQGSVDWKEVGIIAGALLALASILRFLFLPLVERSVRKILTPELNALTEAVGAAAACAKELATLLDLVRSIDEELTTVYQVVRAQGVLLADMNEAVPRIAGVDRRQEQRRREPELLQLPERRRLHRRREDT